MLFKMHMEYRFTFLSQYEYLRNMFVLFIHKMSHFFYILPVILTGFSSKKFNAAAFKLHSGSHVFLE